MTSHHSSMKLVILGIYLLFGSVFWLLSEQRQATVDIYMKSLKLVTINSEYLSLTTPKCGFKTTRKIPTGLFTCEAYLLKRIDSLFMQVKLFYKYGTIYRDYLINYKRIEVCEFLKKHRSVKYSNPLADLGRIGLTYCCPLLDHECPFNPGWYNATNIDFNGTLAPLMPPVIPAGQFKLYVRAYFENNETFGEYEISAVAKPNHTNRAGDFSMLGMG